MSDLKTEIAELRNEKKNTAVVVMFFCYSLVLAHFYAVNLWGWKALILGVPFLGLLQYYIVISGHEAVHKTLCYPLRLNDFFGVFGQALVGVSFNAYRMQHIDHHRSSDHTADPDAHIYYTVIQTPSGWKRFIRLTLGTVIEIFVKIHQKGSGGYGTDRKIKDPIVSKMKRDSLFVILAQLAIMGLSAFVLSPHLSVYLDLMTEIWLVQLPILMGLSYFFMWIVPLFGVTVFLNRCRICIEHGLAFHISQVKIENGEIFGGPRIPTVDIDPGWFQRRIFAPFSFNFHCSHHLFMGVPHYNLPKLNALLRQKKYDGHHQIDGGYIQALTRLVKVK